MPDLPVLDARLPASHDEALALCSALQQRAHDVGATLRTPPHAPTTCCGRGCNGCVWEAYYSAVAYWREEALLQLQP